MILRRSGLTTAAAILLGLALAGPATAEERALPASRSEIQLSYAPIVHTVSPAVVNVYAARVVAQRNTLFDDPLFRRFFGNSVPFGGRKRVQEALGSGVIVDRSGLVVTNNHVIEGATELKVSLVDQRQFDAEVVIADPRMDLAVLRIKGGSGDFPTVPLADDDSYEVGDLVLAIGNPYGLGQTVTSGIVSAVRHIDLGEGDDRVFIQTDAAINQGNSGGALVNMKGRLIGINSAILSPSGANAGIGFAIPSSLVRLIVASAEAGKTSVARPWLGASLQSVTPDIARSMNLPRPEGALVSDVEKDSPAAEAGLKPGDLVTAVDDHETGDAAEVTYLFTTRPIGSTASLAVRRDGRDLVVPVKVETAPEVPPRDQITLAGRGPLSGATVVNISPAVSQQLGLSGVEKGVAVSAVADGSIAAQVGFQKGDVVLSLNGSNVGSTHELDRLNGDGSRVWRITLDRGGQRLSQVLRY
ncbi:MAG TPA: Do family serine endopeptidase [Hyphomicrobiales bacterium]|nr:Do family serine endopeptidase [Hyphomicrobiales bacterium]